MRGRPELYGRRPPGRCQLLGRRERNFFFFFPSWLPHFLVGVFTPGPRAFKEKAERLLEQELAVDAAVVTKWGMKKKKKNPAAH